MINSKETVSWEDKIWGRVMHVFSSSKVGISCLEVNKGFECSRHFHAHRKNAFAVMSGKLLILEWLSPDFDVCSKQPDTKTILSKGQTYTIDAHVDHKFCVLESGIVIEYYSPELECDTVSINDIVRKDIGGTISDDVMKSYTR